MKHLTLTLKSSDLQDTGQFEGYASTFGNVDQGGDLIEPGAFRESVAKARAEGAQIHRVERRQPCSPRPALALQAGGESDRATTALGPDAWRGAAI